jgi:hypothetical protein
MRYEKIFDKDIWDKADYLYDNFLKDKMCLGKKITDQGLYESTNGEQGCELIKAKEVCSILINHLQSFLEYQNKFFKEEGETRMAEIKAEESVKYLDKKVETGDVVDFTMGSGTNKKIFRREVTQVNEKTISVEFDQDYPCTTSEAKVGKKNIKFEKIIGVVEQHIVGEAKEEKELVFEEAV